MRTFLTIDLGGTSIKSALMKEDGSFTETCSIPTPKESLAQFLEVMDTLILPVSEKISGIAMSMPGLVDHQTGHIHIGGAISSYMNDVPLKEIMEKRYKLPVSIENDGKCAALAEGWIGKLKDVKSGAVILIGSGIGGGILLDGKLWRGAHGSAGEFSYLMREYTHNDFTSFWSYSNAINGLLAPFAQKKNRALQEIDGKLFFEALQSKDSDALSVFDTYIQHLLSGLLTLQAVLDIEKYCIGGGISAQDVLIEAIQTAVDAYFDSIPDYVPLIKPAIDRCAYQNDANLVGALKNFLNLHG